MSTYINIPLRHGGIQNCAYAQYQARIVPNAFINVVEKPYSFIVTLVHEFKHAKATAVRNIDNLHQHIHIWMIKDRHDTGLLHLIYNILIGE